MFSDIIYLILQEEEVEVKQEQTIFTVKLTKFDESKKIALIKQIKSLVSGMNLVQVRIPHNTTQLNI